MAPRSVTTRWTTSETRPARGDWEADAIAWLDAEQDAIIAERAGPFAVAIVGTTREKLVATARPGPPTPTTQGQRLALADLWSEPADDGKRAWSKARSAARRSGPSARRAPPSPTCGSSPRGVGPPAPAHVAPRRTGRKTHVEAHGRVPRGPMSCSRWQHHVRRAATYVSITTRRRSVAASPPWRCFVSDRIAAAEKAVMMSNAPPLVQTALEALLATLCAPPVNAEEAGAAAIDVELTVRRSVAMMRHGSMVSP